MRQFGMFTQLRKNTIENARWKNPPHPRNTYIATSFEVWKYTDDVGRKIIKTHHDRLKDEELPTWATQRTPSTSQNSSSHHMSLTGGLRVLACERKSGEVYNLSLPVSDQSYYVLEQNLNLHPSTLPSFYNLNGACSFYRTYESQEPRKVRSVAIVIKASQKVQVGTWGLSLSHDFPSAITTAFILMEPVYRNNEWSHFVLEPLLDELWKLIEATPQFCNHPTFLPTVLLCIHIHRATDYCIWHGNKRLYELEEQMGITRTGVLARESARNFLADKTVREAQSNSWSLLVNLNCRLTETIFMIRVSEWHKDCVSFLLNSTEETKVISQHSEEASNNILEMLQYLRFTSKSLFDYNNEHKSRIQSQLDALFLFQSQIDNFLSAHLAESSGYDGIAMKTLAFVTTLFLPATFVATLFSMSMFNWIPPPVAATEGSSPVLSPHFWIYWAVTLPLMFVVIVAWVVWRRQEIERYRKNVWDRKIDLQTQLEPRNLGRTHRHQIQSNSGV